LTEEVSGLVIHPGFKASQNTAVMVVPALQMPVVLHH